MKSIPVSVVVFPSRSLKRFNIQRLTHCLSNQTHSRPCPCAQKSCKVISPQHRWVNRVRSQHLIEFIRGYPLPLKLLEVNRRGFRADFFFGTGTKRGAIHNAVVIFGVDAMLSTPGNREEVVRFNPFSIFTDVQLMNRSYFELLKILKTMSFFI